MRSLHGLWSTLTDHFPFIRGFFSSVVDDAASVPPSFSLLSELPGADPDSTSLSLGLVSASFPSSVLVEEGVAAISVDDAEFPTSFVSGSSIGASRIDGLPETEFVSLLAGGPPSDPGLLAELLMAIRRIR